MTIFENITEWVYTLSCTSLPCVYNWRLMCCMFEPEGVTASQSKVWTASAGPQYFLPTQKPQQTLRFRAWTHMLYINQNKLCSTCALYNFGGVINKINSCINHMSPIRYRRCYSLCCSFLCGIYLRAKSISTDRLPMYWSTYNTTSCYKASRVSQAFPFSLEVTWLRRLTTLGLDTTT